MGRLMAVQSPGAWIISLALTLGASLAISTAFAQSATSGVDGASAPGTPSRAEELARDANKAFDRFLKGEDPRGAAPAPPVGVETGTALDRTRHAIESGSDWLARVQRSYRAVVERLSEATVPNPVADAAERQAAERAKLWARRGEVERAPGDRVVIADGDQGTLIGDARELMDQARREMQARVVEPLSSPGSTVETASAGEHGQPQPREQSSPDNRPSDSQMVAQATPEVTSGREQLAETEQSADGAGALGWLNRGYRAFQRDVVGKLAATPRDGPPPGAVNGVPPATVEPDNAASRHAGPQQTAVSDATASSFVKSASEGGAVATTPGEPKGVLDDARRLEEPRLSEMLRKAEMERHAAELRAKEATKQAEAEAANKLEAERQAEARKAAEAARLAEAQAADAAKKLEAERQAEARKAAEVARLAEAHAADAAKKLEAERQTEARKAAEAAKRANEMARLAELRRTAEQRAVSDARRAKEAADRAATETARLAAESKSANATNADTSPGGGGGASSGQPVAQVQPGALTPNPQDVAGTAAVSPNVINAAEKAKRRVADRAREAEASARKQADRAAAAVKTIETAKREAELAVDGKARRRADRLIEREARNAAQAARRAIAAAAVLGKVAPIQRPVGASVGPSPIVRPDAATLAGGRRSATASPRTTRASAAGCSSAGSPIRRPGWYVVSGGDSLWTIAEAHYGDGERYRRILRANNRRLQRSGDIAPCQRIYLP